MVKLFRKIAIVSAVALACTGAQAASYDWGLVAGGTTVTAASVGGGNVSGGLFEDTYAFSVGDPLSLDSSVAVDITLGGQNITGGQYSLWSNADGILGNADDSRITNWWTFDGTTGATVNNKKIFAGNYFFDVQGTGGELGGNYLLDSRITTLVPEPESYAMLLAGLGLMGFIARRRQRNAAA